MFETVKTWKINRKMQGKPHTIGQFILGVERKDRQIVIVGIIAFLLINAIMLLSLFKNLLV